MKTLTLDTQIGEDGVLRLELPCGLPSGRAEVAVVVQSAEREQRSAAPGRSLRGIWAGKLPDIDVEADLEGMRRHWERCLDIPE